MDQMESMDQLNETQIDEENSDITEVDGVSEKIMNAALNLFNKTLTLLEVNETLLREVLGSEKTSSFLWNLVQVYRVCQRVKRGRQVSNIIIQVEQTWNLILKKVKTKYSYTPNLWDFSDCCQENASNTCKICLLDVSKTSKETSTHLMESVISESNGVYCSICANFWANCVDELLPT